MVSRRRRPDVFGRSKAGGTYSGQLPKRLGRNCSLETTRQRAPVENAVWEVPIRQQFTEKGHVCVIYYAQCIGNQKGATTMRWYHYVAYFFGGHIPRERPTPFRQWNLGPCFPEPLRIPARSRLVLLYRQCLMGSIQPCRRLPARLSCRLLQSAEDPTRARPRGRYPADMAAHAFGRLHGGL